MVSLRGVPLEFHSWAVGSAQWVEAAAANYSVAKQFAGADGVLCGQVWPSDCEEVFLSGPHQSGRSALGVLS